jgi:hypothetical protein
VNGEFHDREDFYIIFRSKGVPVNNLLVRSRSACSASHRMLVSSALEPPVPARADGLAVFPAALS